MEMHSPVPPVNAWRRAGSGPLNSASSVMNGLTDVVYSAINMIPLNAFGTFSCGCRGQRNPAANNTALND